MSIVRFGFAPLYRHVGMYFSGRKHIPAAKCIIIHTGGMQETKRLAILADGIHQHTLHEAIMQNIKSRDGERLRTFYGIENQQLPAILITVDGGMLVHHWTKENIPSVADISYFLRQLTA